MFPAQILKIYKASMYTKTWESSEEEPKEIVRAYSSEDESENQGILWSWKDVNVFYNYVNAQLCVMHNHF